MDALSHGRRQAVRSYSRQSHEILTPSVMTRMDAVSGVERAPWWAALLVTVYVLGLAVKVFGFAAVFGTIGFAVVCLFMGVGSVVACNRGGGR